VETKLFLWWAWQPFVGLSGDHEIALALTEKKIRSPTEIVCLASSFLLFWAELQQLEVRGSLVAGAEALKNMALHLHPQGGVPREAGRVMI